MHAGNTRWRDFFSFSSFFFFFFSLKLETPVYCPARKATIAKHLPGSSDLPTTLKYEHPRSDAKREHPHSLATPDQVGQVYSNTYIGMTLNVRTSSLRQQSVRRGAARCKLFSGKGAIFRNVDDDFIDR